MFMKYKRNKVIDWLIPYRYADHVEAGDEVIVQGNDKLILANVTKISSEIRQGDLFQWRLNFKAVNQQNLSMFNQENVISDLLRWPFIKNYIDLFQVHLFHDLAS